MNNISSSFPSPESQPTPGLGDDFNVGNPIERAFTAGPANPIDGVELARASAAGFDFFGDFSSPALTLLLSPGFGQLTPLVQQRMLDEVATAPDTLSSLQQMAASANFRALPEDSQAWAVYELSKHRSPPTRFGVDDLLDPSSPTAQARKARGTITDLANLPGLDQLAPIEQVRLLKYVGGNNPISNQARQSMSELMPALRTLPADSVAQALRTFVTQQFATPIGASDLFPPQGPRQSFSVSGPVAVQAGVGPQEQLAAAQQYTATIGKHTIKITIADPPPAGAPSAQDVASALALQAPHGLLFTKEVLVSADSSLGGAANAGNGKIILFPGARSQPQLEQLLSHEAAHMFSDRLLGDWTTDPRYDQWQNAIGIDGIFPSLYGHTKFNDEIVSGKHNPTEDFAEALLTYWSVKGTPKEIELRELMPTRWQQLDQLSVHADVAAILQQII